MFPLTTSSSWYARARRASASARAARCCATSAPAAFCDYCLLAPLLRQLLGTGGSDLRLSPEDALRDRTGCNGMISGANSRSGVPSGSTQIRRWRFGIWEGQSPWGSWPPTHTPAPYSTAFEAIGPRGGGGGGSRGERGCSAGVFAGGFTDGSAPKERALPTDLMGHAWGKLCPLSRWQLAGSRSLACAHALRTHQRVGQEWLTLPYAQAQRSWKNIPPAARASAVEGSCGARAPATGGLAPSEPLSIPRTTPCAPLLLSSSSSVGASPSGPLSHEATTFS